MADDPKGVTVRLDPVTGSGEAAEISVEIIDAAAAELASIVTTGPTAAVATLARTITQALEAHAVSTVSVTATADAVVAHGRISVASGSAHVNGTGSIDVTGFGFSADAVFAPAAAPNLRRVLLYLGGGAAFLAGEVGAGALRAGGADLYALAKAKLLGVLAAHHLVAAEPPRQALSDPPPPPGHERVEPAPRPAAPEGADDPFARVKKL